MPLSPLILVSGKSHPTRRSMPSVTCCFYSERQRKMVRIVRLFVELHIDAVGTFQKRAYSPDGTNVRIIVPASSATSSAIFGVSG